MSDKLDPHEQKVVADVARFGWHCMRVASAIDDPIQTTFAYTIGLNHSYGWPELICLGLDTEILQRLLAGAIDELRSQSALPRPGMVLTEVAHGYSCRLAEFSSSLMHQDLGWALWFARHEGYDPSQIQCLQLVWPDRHGRFPDNPDCVVDVRLLQTPVEN
jgi:Domain of unknown function (DUF4262)